MSKALLQSQIRRTHTIDNKFNCDTRTNEINGMKKRKFWSFRCRQRKSASGILALYLISVPNRMTWRFQPLFPVEAHHHSLCAKLKNMTMSAYVPTRRTWLFQHLFQIEEHGYFSICPKQSNIIISASGFDVHSWLFQLLVQAVTHTHFSLCPKWLDMAISASRRVGKAWPFQPVFQVVRHRNFSLSSSR